MAELKLIDIEEVDKHNTADSTWIILNNKVYDVTKFLVEHPGGEEVILDMAGQDATEVFNDIGHSTDAKQMAEDYVIGKLKTDKAPPTNVPKKTIETLVADDSWQSIILSPTWTNFFIPVGISISVFLIYKLTQHLTSRLQFS